MTAPRIVPSIATKAGIKRSAASLSVGLATMPLVAVVVWVGVSETAE